jgi:hypothetical protein
MSVAALKTCSVDLDVVVNIAKLRIKIRIAGRYG